MGILRSAEVRKKLLRAVKSQGPSIALPSHKGAMTHDAVIHATGRVTHDCPKDGIQRYKKSLWAVDFDAATEEILLIPRNAATTDATSRILDDHSSGVDEHTADRLKQRQPEVLKKLLTPADINKFKNEMWAKKNEEETQ